MDCPPGQKIMAEHECREVAVVERWPLVEVRLYKEKSHTLNVCDTLDSYIHVHVFHLNCPHLGLK